LIELVLTNVMTSTKLFYGGDGHLINFGIAILLYG